MPIRVVCPGCGRKSQAPDSAAGRRAKCPGCGQTLTIPEPAPVAPAPEAGPLDVDALMAADAAATAALPLAPVRKKKRGANTRLVVYAAAGGGALLLVLILLVLLLTPGDGPTAPTAASSSAPAAPSSATASPPAAAPSGPAFPDAVTEPPDWLVKDAPFDVAAFFAAPPPEENAAPLYLDALYEFGDEVAECFPEEERARRSPVAKQRAERFGKLYESWEKDPASVDPAAADAVLAEFDVGFQKLARAQERKRCVFQTGISLTSLLPHADAARTVARVAQIRAARNLAQGQIDPVLQEMEVLLRLSYDLCPRGPVVSHLVSFANEAIVCREVVPQLLATPGLAREHCDRLNALLARQREEESFAAFLQVEYVLTRSFMYDLENRVGIFDPKVLSGKDSPREFLDEEYGKGATDAMLRLPPAHLQREVRVLNEWYSILNRLAGAGLAEREDVPERLLKDAEKERVVLVPAIHAYWPGLAQAIARNEAITRGTRCLVALRRWELEKGTPATDLEAAVRAAGMPGVPRDPYGDGPLRMTLGDGRPVVYSVGLDGDDDGGRVEWDEDPESRNGDFLFRLPAAR